MNIETTTSHGMKVCPFCFQSYPAVYAHYCPKLPSGPPGHMIRGFSEEEIRQIVREEIKRASVNGT